jgi:hypothetical protein
MKIDRSKAETPIVNSLAAELSSMRTPCVGCPGCDGLCAALIDTMVLPDLILARKRESQ